MRKLYGLMLLLFGISQFGSAQAFVPPMPDQLERVRVSLLTVGIGAGVHARFGHSMFRVEDFDNKLDYVVNWGLFDFSDPLFIPKFLRGRLIYRVGFNSTTATVAYYRDVEKRSVVQDEINLTSSQKRILIEKIIWNSQPANVYFPYQYFRNNCATIPRDYLDLVTHGFIRNTFKDAITSMTYRDHIWINIGTHPVFGWGLDVILNGDADLKLSKWQEMFNPLKLREYLSRLQAVKDDGQRDSSRMMLSNNRVLADVPEPNSEYVDGYHMTWLFAGAPLLILMVSLLLGRLFVVNSKFNQWRLRLLGFVSVVCGLTFGCFGFIHCLAWIFSDHTDLHRNFNMLLFWPVDTGLLFLAYRLFAVREDSTGSAALKFGFWRIFAFFHIVSALIFLCFYWLGKINQDVSRVALYLAPVTLLYYGLVIVMLRSIRVR